MAQATANFELGTQGVTIATSDAGSANAWDAVSIVASGAAIYDNAHVYQTLAAKLTTGATAGSTYLQWSAATLGTLTDNYGRAYIYRTANPPGSSNLFLWRTTGAIRGKVQITNAGKVELCDRLSVVQKTSTNSIALNQFVRLEARITNSATVGFIECLLFNSPDSTTPTETISTLATIDTGTSHNEFLVGHGSSIANQTMWADNIVWGATSYPGPSAATNVKSGMGVIGP